MTTIADFRRMKAEYEEKLKTDGLAAMKAAFIDFFNEHPDIHALSWRQYTPYFNDGDPCVFGVREPYYFRTEDVKDGVAWERYSDIIEDERWFYFDRKILGEFWASLGNDDIFEVAFGDHVTVVATREGFTILDYNHD